MKKKVMKEWSAFRSGMAATRAKRLRCWDGYMRINGDVGNRSVVTQECNIGKGIDRVTMFSKRSQGKMAIAIRAEVTGHPNLALPEEPGIWEVDSDFNVVQRVDCNSFVFSIPEVVERRGPIEAPKRSQPEGDGPKFCMCGCGSKVKSRFLPGHDAKLKGRLIQTAKGNGTLDPPYDGDYNPWSVADSFGWLHKLPEKNS